MFVCFIDERLEKLVAVELPDGVTARDIDHCLPCRDWFGSPLDSREAAIQQSIDQKFPACAGLIASDLEVDTATLTANLRLRYTYNDQPRLIEDEWSLPKRELRYDGPPSEAPKDTE